MDNGQSMLNLLSVLTPIGLLDSASMTPISIALLAVLLTGPHPLARSAALLLGICFAYLICGLLILLGLQSVFDQISAYTLRVWHNPETEELILQILVGLLLCTFGVRIATARRRRSDKPAASEMTARQALLTGAVITITGLPGAVPYLAAIELILRSDATQWWQILALGYYNIVFILPMVAVVVLCLLAGEHSRGILDAVRGFIDVWGQRLVVSLLLILGITLTADGVAWLLGHPLLPV